MKKIHFNTTINAPKEKVWKVLFDLPTYEVWTKVFAEGSTVQTDNWKEGSRVIFGDGTGNGMVARIKANKPNEFMSIQHLGQIKDGVEDTTSEAVQAWAGAEENYTLTEKDGKTELKVDMDTSGAEFEDFLIKAWPTALEKVKELAEAPENKKSITIETIVNAPMEKVWERFTAPEHITKWAFATDEWHAPLAENDLRVGGQFKTRMEAKDGSMGFDFGGEYTKVEPHQAIEYCMSDGREVKVYFSKSEDGSIKVVETFDMEHTNSEELQRNGWQAILDNFKKHTETSN